MARIVTLTPNPALDLAASVDRVGPTFKMRCTEPRRDPGGGGINVARVVKRFGGAVEAIFPVGGCTGQLLHQLVTQEGIVSRTVAMEGETRENFSVTELASSAQYRFVLPGARLREAEWRALLAALAATQPAPNIVVSSGSLPPGAPADFYSQAAAVARQLGAKFFLDTSGEPLAAAVEGGVDLIKPNLREMRELSGVPLSADADYVAAARHHIDTGRVGIVALSLGHHGALLVTRDGAWRAEALPITPLSTVGAGDSFLAAIAFSLAKGDCPADALRLGVAAGSAALLHKGTGLSRSEDAYRLSAEVQVTVVRS